MHIYFQYNFHLLLAEIRLLLKDQLDTRYRDKSLSKNCLASSEHEDSALVFAVECSRYLLPACVSPAEHSVRNASAGVRTGIIAPSSHMSL